LTRGIHNHILFCAASFQDHHKYVSNKKSYAAIRRTSDRLCEEYGLSVVVAGKDKGKHYAEHLADRTGGSWKSKLKAMIGTTIPQAQDFDDFLRRMEAAGYEVKRVKYVSFRAPGRERFTRAKTLGEDYTEDAIAKRISDEYVRAPRTAHNTQKEKPAVSLLIDIESNIKAQQSAGYSRWAKIANLKEAANTLNFLTENGLLQYADLESKTAEVTTAFDDAATSLKGADRKLTDMAVLMKHIETYQQTKPVAVGLKTAKDKDAYRRAHEGELILHDAAARAIRTTRPSSGKLPNLTALRAEHAKLTGRRDALKADYAALRKQVHDIGVVKRNVDSILSVDAGKTKSKDRGKDL
jgi:hypothetical protein